MNNPFDNIPSSADMPEPIDKKTLSSLSSLVERIEIAVSRNEAAAKNQEELAGAVFETFLDDDGSMKDFSHSAEIKAILHQTERRMDAKLDRVENLVNEIPTTIEARLCEEDRNRLDKNFQSWNNVYQLHLPLFWVIGLIVGICILVCVLATKSATDKRIQYEHRLEQLYHWKQENAEVIGSGLFYRDYIPDSYDVTRNVTWR